MWQPIDTAPMDETFIVAVVGSESNGSFKGWKAVHPVYRDEFGVYDDVGIERGSFVPTHWMPLPDPPNE